MHNHLHFTFVHKKYVDLITFKLIRTNLEITFVHKNYVDLITFKLIRTN